MTDERYHEDDLARDIADTFGRESPQALALLQIMRERTHARMGLSELTQERAAWRTYARQAELTMYQSLGSIRKILDHGD